MNTSQLVVKATLDHARHANPEQAVAITAAVLCALLIFYAVLFWCWAYTSIEMIRNESHRLTESLREDTPAVELVVGEAGAGSDI